MYLKRKVIKVEFNEQEYDFVLDFESAIEFQDMYGKSIFLGLTKISEEQDIFALACLIASCVKDNDQAVGLDFVKKLNLMKTLGYFMDLIPELVDNSVPSEESPVKKK